MNTSHLDYFITISETGSLSRAAERLHVSQPVLSRYLHALEQEQGLAMFRRERGIYKLTEAGRIYLNGVTRIRELRTQLLRQLMALSGCQPECLDIGMSPYRGGREIASFYPPLLNQFPTLELNIMENNSATIFKALQEKELTSLLTIYDEELMPDAQVASLQTYELLLVLPRYHPLCLPYRDQRTTGTLQHPAKLTRTQLQTLTDIPFILMDDQTSAVGRKIQRICSDNGLIPQVFLKTSNTIALSLLLASGIYASFIMASPGRAIENLCYFHLPTPVSCTSGMVFRKNYEPGRVECYLYRLETELASAQGLQYLDINAFGEELLKRSQNDYESL